MKGKLGGICQQNGFYECTGTDMVARLIRKCRVCEVGMGRLGRKGDRCWQ